MGSLQLDSSVLSQMKKFIDERARLVCVCVCVCRIIVRTVRHKVSGRACQRQVSLPIYIPYMKSIFDISPTAVNN